MQSYYAYYGSKLVLWLEDSVAESYNRAVDAFLEAQQHFLDRMGHQWNPNHPLEIDINNVDVQAFNNVAGIINALSVANGGGLDIPEEDITSDHLIKVDISILRK